jgi:cell wall-associated NlpC family hydrolase
MQRLVLVPAWTSWEVLDASLGPLWRLGSGRHYTPVRGESVAVLRYRSRVAKQLRPGDVLFFRVRSPKLSHVGIFTGGGRFLNAPSVGKQVSYESPSNPFWRDRLFHAGRLY